MRYSKWEVAGYDRADAVKLCKKGVNPLLAVLLSSRGLTSDKDLIEMFDPTNVAYLNDPMLMKGMEGAAARIRLAMENGEKVGIFGDYDVDGITATCLLARFFTIQGTEFVTYIPERMEDGYGLNRRGIDYLKASGVSLIVTVDCGSTAYIAAEYAHDAGLDLVITDHHECGEEIPVCCAMINPKQSGCPYPEKNLSGVGVAFKLVCALEGAENSGKLLNVLGDFVAVGTLADVMPVRGENRILIRLGLEVLRKNRRKGFRYLLSAANVDAKTIGGRGLSFAIAPRLNAAGRLGQTGVAVKLLLSSDDDEARALSEELCTMNRTRQEIESSIMNEALEMLAKDPPDNEPVILAKEGWHQGVAGIVASRLLDMYGVPTMVMSITDGIAHGSCRSTATVSVYDMLKECSDVIESFGGHKMAAGVSVRVENLPELRRRCSEYFRAHASEYEEPALNIDFEVINPDLLTLENYDSLIQIEPFGSGNAAPRLCMRNVEIDMITSIGGGKHTKFWLTKDNTSFECVFFNAKASSFNYDTGDLIDIAFELKNNEFRGRRSLQLLLNDIRPAQQ